MTVSTEAAAAADAGAEGNEAAGASGNEEATGIESEEGGVTPEEIKSVLKGAGHKTDSIPDAAKGEEEGSEGEETEEEKAAGAGEGEEEEVVTPPAKTEPEAPKAPEAGDAPKFTLEVEDADGNKFEISKIDDLPEDFSPKTNRQGLEILDKLQELRAEKAAYDKDQETKTAEAASAERVAKIQEGWQNEFKELGITTKAAQDEIYAYMGTENAKREEQGRPMIASIEDAKNGMDAKAAREAAAEAEKAAKDEARRKGSLVGGGAVPGGSGSTPVYRGGARNATAALKGMGLL